MAAGEQTNNGKAFEYACLMSLFHYLNEEQEIVIEDTPQLRTAKAFYEQKQSKIKNNLDAAANAATRVIIRLEPQLQYPSKNIPLYLSCFYKFIVFRFLNRFLNRYFNFLNNLH